MIILQSLAIFWDGTKQLSGLLELRESVLVFAFDDFKHSHLNLKIQLSEIKNAKAFLLFEIAKNGLKIECDNGRIDLFILDKPKFFCDALLLQIRKVSKVK